MTVIAARKVNDSIQFAADSIICTGHMKLGPEATHAGQGKMFEVNGMIVGGTGVSSENQLLYLFCRNHKPVTATFNAVIDFFVEFQESVQKKDSAFKLQNQYLFAFDGCLFRTYGEALEVFEVPAYGAVGAGEHFALAALELGHPAEAAVELAIKLSPWCSGPVNKLQMNVSADKADVG